MLTVLGDKSNATVHHNRDAVFGQLLVTQVLAVRAGGQHDGGVPHREVRPVEAVDVEGSEADRSKGEKRLVFFLLHATIFTRQEQRLIYYKKEKRRGVIKQPPRLKQPPVSQEV